MPNMLEKGNLDRTNKQAINLSQEKKKRVCWGFLNTDFITLCNLVNTLVYSRVCNFPNCVPTSLIAQQSFLDRKKSIFEQYGEKRKMVFSADLRLRQPTAMFVFLIISIVALQHVDGGETEKVTSLSAAATLACRRAKSLLCSSYNRCIFAHLVSARGSSSCPQQRL